MAQAYSGREWSAIVGIADNNAGSSAGAIGAATQDANAVSGSKVLMRVDSPLNMINYSAAYQRAEIAKAGARTLRSTDIENHYGSGVWTWDFDWLCDNEKGLQNLLHLMHPLHGDTITTSITYDATIAPANYAHADETDEDKCAFVILQNPLVSRDHYMHSCILQTLTFSMDAATDGGALRASGQFMTGYKPVIETNGVTVDSSASDYAKGLFDCTTSTFGGDAAVVRSFSLTISNPASRVGYQGSAGETDGYVRSGGFGITGSITMKADSLQQVNDDTFWKANSTAAIALGEGTSLDFALAAVNVSNVAYDMAEEGVFVTVDFVATSGAAGTGDLAVIKMT